MAELRYYEGKILEATGAPVGELSVIEDIMRTEVLHSTLDWLSPAQFRTAARVAYRLLREHRTLYERHYPQLKGA